MTIQNYTQPQPERLPFRNKVLSPGVSPPTPVHVTRTEVARYLGRYHLLEKAPLKPRQLDVSKINSSSEATEALQLLLNKIDTLACEEFVQDDQVLQLDGEISKLETSLARMKVEGTLSAKQFSDFQSVSKKMHDVLGSVEKWAEFQNKYLNLDQQREDSLALTSSTLFSDLHGCSPMAAQGIKEGMEAMQQLIGQAASQISEGTPFAPEVWKELGSSIHSTWFNAEDVCHAVIANIDRIAKEATSLWDEAAQQLAGEGVAPSLDAMRKLQEASTLLLSLEDTLDEWGNSLASQKSLAETSLQNLPADKSGVDPAEYRQMKKRLGQLSATFAGLQAQLPAKQQALGEAIQQRQVTTVAERVIASADDGLIATLVKDKISQYSPDPNETPVKAAKRYAVLKRELIGLLPVSAEARQFVRQEEQRLNSVAGYVEDFDGLVYAKILKERRPEQGWLARTINYWHPENWSDTTKKWVHAGSIAVQLSAQILDIYQKLPTKMLSTADHARVDKETSLLALLMTQERYGKADKALEKLTEKSPEVIATMQALRTFFPPGRFTSIPEHVRQEVEGRFKMYLQDQLLGKETESPKQWVSNLDFTRSASFQATVPRLPDRPGVVEAVAEAAIQEAVAAAQDPAERLMNASKTLVETDRQLSHCSLTEYMQPKGEPISFKEQETLRNEIALMQGSLRATMAAQPEKSLAGPAWATWRTSVSQQCFAVRDLERRIAEAMQAYHEARAMGSLQSEEEATLSVFGNKHLNLVKQANLQAFLMLEGIEIPIPQGVASQQVMQFLEKNSPEVFDNWKQLGELYASHGKDDATFLESGAAKKHLNAIAEGIGQAFAKAGTDPVARESLGISEEVVAWLDELARAGHYLMVRSKGAEDSKKSANAGGNKSVAYVAPTPEEFCNALGEVVISYFSATSLKNRLNIPSNPFEEDLKLAVTAQKLIGEPVGGVQKAQDIPISLVLFSNEPLYIHGEEFRIMRLSATYGHGEGVVGNQGIGSDTILVIQSVAHPDQIVFHPDIHSKPERLAPQIDQVTGKVTLQKMANPPELVERAALSDELVRRLYVWAIVGEKFFDDFTDMEIVIKHDKIYPVQARPVNREAMLPTYLDPKKLEEAPNSPIVKTVPMQLIVPGKASVVEISQASELLISDTLENAQGEYRKGEQKAVVVGKEEPSNSHPVVNFSSWSMPCLYAKDLQEAKELAKAISEKYHVAFCVQSARAFLWDTSKGDVADFSTERFIIHPAQIFKSLPAREKVPEYAGVPTDTPKEVADLLMGMQMATTREKGLRYLQELHTSGFLQDFKAKISELESVVAKEPLQAKLLAPAIVAAKAVDASVEQAFEELNALLTSPKFSGKMEFLFHAKILQTLLFQTKADTGLAQHSVVSLDSAFAAANALIDYQRKLDYPAHFAGLLMDGSQSPLDAAYGQWQNVLLELEPLVEKREIPVADVARFKDTLQTMRQAGVLPIFMTFFLSQVAESPAAQKMQAIDALLPAEEAPRVQELLAQRQGISRIRQDIGLFGNPKAVPEAWDRLQETIAPFLPPQNDWMKKESWAALSPITRNIAIQTLNELVDVYDSSIKAMKASTSIPEEEKVLEFKKMLGLYFDLLKSWAVGTVREEGFLTHDKYPLKTVLGVVKATMEETLQQNLDQLNKSPNFSVSSVVLGSATLFHVFAPRTLEDIFMFTHQSLLATTSAMTKATIAPELIQASSLPGALKHAIKETSNVGGEPIGIPQQTGIEVNRQGIAFQYNIPFRDHSGKFNIKFDRQTAKVGLEVLMVGNDELRRWENGKERVSILDAVGLLKLSEEPKATQQALSYRVDLNDEKQIPQAFTEFRNIALMSMHKEGVENNFFETLRESNSLEKAFKYVLDKDEMYFYSLKTITEMLRQKDALDRMDEVVYKNAFHAAETGMNEEDIVWGVPLSLKLGTASVNLLKEFIANAIYIPEIINLANKNAYIKKSESNEYQKKSYSLVLFKTLALEGYAIQEVIKATAHNMKNDNFYIRMLSLQVLQAVVGKNMVFFEALEVAMEGLKDNDEDVRKEAQLLFDTVVEKIQQNPEALKSQLEKLSDADEDVRNKAQGLLLSLQRHFLEWVKEGQEILLAMTFALEILNAKDEAVRQGARDLLNLLIQKVPPGKALVRLIQISSLWR